MTPPEPRASSGGRLAGPALGLGPPKWQPWEPGARDPASLTPPRPLRTLPAPRFSSHPALGRPAFLHFRGSPLPFSSRAPFTALSVAFTLNSQAQRSKAGLGRSQGRGAGSLRPPGRRGQSRRARFCVASARGVIYLLRASVNMTDVHRGQKAFLRQSILERSLTRQTQGAVLFPALKNKCSWGRPGWGSPNIHGVN